MDSTTEEEDRANVPGSGKHKGVTIEDALRHAGGFGRFQLKAVFAFQLAITCGSLALYPMSFFELQPKYECLMDGKEWEECKAEDFCGTDIQYRINEESRASLQNWVSEYDMTCASKSKFGLFGSLYFAAVVIGSLTFPPLADRVGRRPVTLTGIAIAGIAQSCMLVSPSLNFTYALVFIAGLTMPMRVFTGYIYSMEFLPIRHTELATALTLGFDGLGLALASLYFMYVSKDWKGFMAGACLLCLFAFIYICCVLSESPKFLISRGRYEEARKVIDRIRAQNRLQNFAFDNTPGEKKLEALCREQQGHYACLWAPEVEGFESAPVQKSSS